MQRIPLGEILLRRKLITETQLALALDLQQNGGARLGDILVSHGMIGYYALYHSVAEYYQLPFVNLLEERPHLELLQPADADTYLRLQALPWQRHENHICIAACDLSEDVVQWAKQRFGDKVYFVITSPLDIRRTVEHLFGSNFEHSSRLKLWERRPHASARITFQPQQRYMLLTLLLAILATLIVNPVQCALVLLGICHIVYFATMLFKGSVFAAGLQNRAGQNWNERLSTLNPRKLPVYTILIPMYKEAASLPGMLDWMQKLDYPASKLDIKLVLEADDPETLDAAYALKPRYQFDIIRVPPGELRTKPRACNYALRFARGEFITIFDADDRPERTQIKKAVLTFRSQPSDIICLQARLNYYNTNDNLLTRFFSLEYTILFHFMLYGLERLGIPIPLGGTSNHIALKKLKRLGEWDPYNVTEDADLGTRLASRGFRTAMLDSYTMEECPNSITPWIKQRSRWIKGYMQTWLVHMRHPAALYRKLGGRSFTGFQFFVGFSSFTFLTAPIVWTFSLLWMSGLAPVYDVAFPRWLALLTSCNLLLNLLTHWYFTFYCAQLYRRHTGPVLAAALLYPFYLVLHSIASYRGLYQLIMKPHYWDKTTHGLAKYTDFIEGESGLRPKASAA